MRVFCGLPGYDGSNWVRRAFLERQGLPHAEWVTWHWLKWEPVNVARRAGYQGA